MPGAIENLDACIDRLGDVTEGVGIRLHQDNLGLGGNGMRPLDVEDGLAVPVFIKDGTAAVGEDLMEVSFEVFAEILDARQRAHLACKVDQIAAGIRGMVGIDDDDDLALAAIGVALVVQIAQAISLTLLSRRIAGGGACVSLDGELGLEGLFHDIVASAALGVFDARAADDGVVAIIASKDVIAAVAEDAIVACAAEDGVVSFGPQEQFVALAAFDDVVARSTGDGVVAGSAENTRSNVNPTISSEEGRVG